MRLIILINNTVQRCHTGYKDSLRVSRPIELLTYAWQIIKEEKKGHE